MIGVSPLAWWDFGGRGRTGSDILPGVSLTARGRGHRVVISELATKVTHRKTHDAMTQGRSALLAQLDALKSTDAGAVFAELIRAGLQALIEARGHRCDRRRPLRAHRRAHGASQWTPIQDGVDHLR